MTKDQPDRAKEKREKKKGQSDNRSIQNAKEFIDIGLNTPRGNRSNEGFYTLDKVSQ